MARPLSSSMAYDPYSYYSCKLGQCIYDRPLSSCQFSPGLTRRASIWSTSSICSDDSLLDDRDFDDDDDDDFKSPISPAESSASWSSSGSSSAPRSGHFEQSSTSAIAPLQRFRRTDRPRGPRPLPALPTSQPPSPASPSSHMALPLSIPKVTPPLRLNLKVVTPPPSYAEAMSAGAQEPVPGRGRSTGYLFDTDMDSAPAEFLTSPAEDTIIDWARIEEFMAGCDG